MIEFDLKKLTPELIDKDNLKGYIQTVRLRGNDYHVLVMTKVSDISLSEEALKAIGRLNSPDGVLIRNY